MKRTAKYTPTTISTVPAIRWPQRATGAVTAKTCPSSRALKANTPAASTTGKAAPRP